MPTDAELAAARLPGAALAVALGVRALAAEGHKPTIEKLVTLTGYSRSQVYEARNVLQGRWPTEYPQVRALPSGTPDTSARIPHTESGQADTGITPTTNGHGSLLRGPRTEDVAVWKRCVGARAITVNGRSWDAYDNVYAPAWDDVLEATDPAVIPWGDLIALAAHYVEHMTGEKPDDAARKQVAMLVRGYGKAALYGLSQAMGITADDPTDRFRYARQVAGRVVDELGATP